MKKVLCICNTYYQLIEAIQLKCTLLQRKMKSALPFRIIPGMQN